MPAPRTTRLPVRLSLPAKNNENRLYASEDGTGGCGICSAIFMNRRNKDPAGKTCLRGNAAYRSARQCPTDSFPRCAILWKSACRQPSSLKYTSILTGAGTAVSALICARWGFSCRRTGTCTRGTAISAVPVSGATSSVPTMPSARGGSSGHRADRQPAYLTSFIIRYRKNST